MCGRQDQCLLDFPNFTDFSNVEKSVDGGAVGDHMPPMGDNLDRRPGNGSLSQTDCHQDRHEKQYSNGFAEGSTARTTQLGDEDFNDNPSNTSWKRGGRKWRLQMGLHVRGAVGETVEKSDTHTSSWTDIAKCWNYPTVTETE